MCQNVHVCTGQIQTYPMYHLVKGKCEKMQEAYTAALESFHSALKIISGSQTGEYVIVVSWGRYDRQYVFTVYMHVVQYDILYIVEMCLLISCLVLAQLILTMKPVW